MHGSDEREAFHAAIRRTPDDDLPRLVYADWLDERGHPCEAELLRTQCHLDPHREGVPEPAFHPHVLREQELLRTVRTGGWWAAAWGGGFAQLGPVFVRGVPERAIVSLSFLLAHGRRLFDTFPTLRELAVYDVRHRGPELAECDLIARLDTLEIADWPTPADIQFLLRSPHFGGQSVIRLWAHGTPYGTALSHIEFTRWRPRRRVELVVFGNWWERFAPLARAARECWGPQTCGLVSAFDRPFLAHTRTREPHAFRTGTTRVQRAHYPRPHEPQAQLIAFPIDDWGADVEAFDLEGWPGSHSYRMMKPAGADLDEWLAERFGLEPGPVWVRPFQTQHGHSLRWLPERLSHALRVLSDAPPEDDADHAGGRIKHWLAGGYAEAWNWRAEPNPSILTPRGDLWPE